MSEVTGADVEPSKQEKKPSFEGPAKPPLPIPKDEEYGFTLRNITMLGISGILASSRAIRGGVKWYGSELRHHTKRTVVGSLLAATAIGVSITLLFGPDDVQSKDTPTTENPSTTVITDLDIVEPPFGWNVDACQGATVYTVIPAAETLSEALLNQVPGMDPREVLPIAENVASESNIIGDSGNFLPATGHIEFVGPERC